VLVPDATAGEQPPMLRGPGDWFSDEDGGFVPAGRALGKILYYAFDVLVLAGRDVMSPPLSARREARAAAVR